jgi:hypothetical protein
VTLAPIPSGQAGYEIVEATNLFEDNCHTHYVRPGTPVGYWLEYDSGSPPTARHLMLTADEGICRSGPCSSSGSSASSGSSPSLGSAPSGSVGIYGGSSGESGAGSGGASGDQSVGAQSTAGTLSGGEASGGGEISGGGPTSGGETSGSQLSGGTVSFAGSTSAAGGGSTGSNAPSACPACIEIVDMPTGSSATPHQLTLNDITGNYASADGWTLSLIGGSLWTLDDGAGTTWTAAAGGPCPPMAPDAYTITAGFGTIVSISPCSSGSGAVTSGGGASGPAGCPTCFDVTTSEGNQQLVATIPGVWAGAGAWSLGDDVVSGFWSLTDGTTTWVAPITGDCPPTNVGSWTTTGSGTLISITPCGSSGLGNASSGASAGGGASQASGAGGASVGGGASAGSGGPSGAGGDASGGPCDGSAITASVTVGGAVTWNGSVLQQQMIVLNFCNGLYTGQQNGSLLTIDTPTNCG